MIKSILVSMPGFDSDKVALETSLLLGGPFGAHLACLHIRPGPAEFSFGFPGSDVAGVLASDLAGRIREQDRIHTDGARMAFDFLRKRFNIPLVETPSTTSGVTAAWREKFGNDIDRVIAEARYHDITVFGRVEDFRPLSPDALGQIVIDCGRPVLLAASETPLRIGHTIGLAWKDCAEAARAITAASPLIRDAQQVFVVAGREEENDRPLAIHGRTETTPPLARRKERNPYRRSRRSQTT